MSNTPSTHFLTHIPPPKMSPGGSGGGGGGGGGGPDMISFGGLDMVRAARGSGSEKRRLAGIFRHVAAKITQIGALSSSPTQGNHDINPLSSYFHERIDRRRSRQEDTSCRATAAPSNQNGETGFRTLAETSLSPRPEHSPNKRQTDHWHLRTSHLCLFPSVPWSALEPAAHGVSVRVSHTTTKKAQREKLEP